ncbi:MAG: hypothetical protein WC022_00345 [Parcubacteria group bacterium]
MPVKKVITGVALGAVVLILTGCGNKTVTTQESSQSGQAKNGQAAENSAEPKMPAATGRVDDTVNAVIDGATNESTAAASTDADASGAVGDDEDTNNLNSTYDQNAL